MPDAIGRSRLRDYFERALHRRLGAGASFVGLPYRRLMYELSTGRFLSASRAAGSSISGPSGKANEPLLIAKMLPALVDQWLDPVHGQQGRAEPNARSTSTMSTLASETLRNERMLALRDVSRALQSYLKEDFLCAANLAQSIKDAPSFMGGGKELGSFLSLVEISHAAET